MSNSTVATCLTPNDWSYNSLGQSPCDVASALAGVCVGGQFTLSPLAPDYVYLGPSVANANSCRCSSVYYSLLSACANCQGRNFLRWSAYDGNCTTIYPTVFPQPIPAGTVVPHYAYLDVRTGDTFNVTVAETAGGAESSPVSTAVATKATGTGTSSKSATLSHSPTQTGSKAKSSPNVGAIAGGVIGGVILLALFAGLIFWLIRRNNRKAPPASQMYYGPDTASSPPPMSFGGTSTYTTMPTAKIYDPSDPSTYPSHAPPTTYTPPPHANVTPNYTGASQNTAVASPGPRYTGVPEL